jgi:hypothetical protein
MLIQDVKPYPSRLQALVAGFHARAVQMNGIKIKLSHAGLETAEVYPPTCKHLNLINWECADCLLNVE